MTLAVRPADVTELNDSARAPLLASGRLGLDAVTVGAGSRQREYRAGDRVLVIANDYRLGLLNGTCAVITAVDPQHESLTFLAVTSGASPCRRRGWTGTSTTATP